MPSQVQRRANRIIEEDAAEDKGNVYRIPVTIEEKRSKDKPGFCYKYLLLPVESKIYGKRNREKEKNKYIRIKEHPLNPSRLMDELEIPGCLRIVVENQRSPETNLSCQFA
jgi:hypothetical protein